LDRHSRNTVLSKPKLQVFILDSTLYPESGILFQ
jgi:hypothetical protein